MEWEWGIASGKSAGNEAASEGPFMSVLYGNDSLPPKDRKTKRILHEPTSSLGRSWGGLIDGGGTTLGKSSFWKR